MIRTDYSFSPNQLNETKLTNTKSFSAHYNLEFVDNTIQELFQAAFNVYKEKYFGHSAYCTVSVKNESASQCSDTSLSSKQLSILILLKNTTSNNLEWDSAHLCSVNPILNDARCKDFIYNISSFVIVSKNEKAEPTFTFQSQKQVSSVRYNL